MLSGELGRAPTRSEFTARFKGGDYAIRCHFRTYACLLQAAGLETYDQRRGGTRITNEIFRRDIVEHLSEYTPREIPKQAKAWPRIAIMGDLHEPFSHAGCKEAFFDFLRYQVATNQAPEYIIQVGDAIDAYSWSKHPRSHNVFTPKEEERLARENLAKFWQTVREIVPAAKCVMLLGNHAVRPIKRALEVLPSAEHWVEAYLKELLTFEGVETIMDPREEYAVADIAFVHGWKGGQGNHMMHLHRNTVLGHLHVGNCTFRNIRAPGSGGLLFELNVGHCSDEFSSGLSYTPSRTTGWTLGFGWIDAFGPRFIPYVARDQKSEN